MRRSRSVAIAIVLGAALVAHAIGNGDIKPTTPVIVTTITSTSAGANGTATLQNTTTATTYNVLVGADATCDPMLSFSVPGGNPITSFAPQTSRNVTLTCPARGSAAMRRCLYHATNSANATALADFEGVCVYGASPGTLTPQQTSIDFGNVVVGQSQSRTLDLHHDGLASQHIRRVYMTSSDIDGNFRFSTPCNPDTAFCHQDLGAQVDVGGTLSVQINCTPQTPGTHTAQVFVGTDTFQLMTTGVTVTCNGTPAPGPVLGVNPSRVELPSPVEVIGASAKTAVHLRNPGGTTLTITDVRTVDVDTGTANDWTYQATGVCAGQITSMCVLDPGEGIDLEVTFDPSVIGRRRATLLVSYKDTLGRTTEIPLDGVGLGATLHLVGAMTTLPFGSVPLGRSSQLQVDLANTGNRDTVAMLSVMPGAPFTVAPPTSATVTPTAHKTLTLGCSPTMAGSASGTVTVQAMDTVQSPTIAIATSCEGSTLDVYANPTSLILGEVRTAEGTVTRTVQVLSDSGAPLTLAGPPQLETANASITLGTLSGTTTPATFDVRFDPSGLSASQITNSIAVATTAGETLHIPFSARVVKASYLVATAVDLGTFCIGQATTSSNMSLVSDGTATLELDAPTLGKSPSPFDLSLTSPPLYPSSLVPGGTATLAITPHRQLSVTTVMDTLTWRTNQASAQTSTTMLTARFTDRGGAIAPPAVDFGAVTVHLFSDDGQRVVLQNCNDTPLMLDPPMIRTPFSIDSPSFPSVLDPNETISFSVGFHPTRKGVVMDTLRISSPQLPDGPLEVLLVGEGRAPEPTGADAGTGSNGMSDTSFYACACSSAASPLGGIPIVVALAFLAFPRRRRARYSGQR